MECCPNMATILLIEDERDSRDLVRMTLEMDGHVVVEAETGEQGVERAAESTPDVVLVDVCLPGEIDGVEATRRIRAIPQLERVPIVAVTAQAMRGVRERVLEAGCDAYIPKPITDLMMLRSTVRKLVGSGRS